MIAILSRPSRVNPLPFTDFDVIGDQTRLEGAHKHIDRKGGNAFVLHQRCGDVILSAEWIRGAQADVGAAGASSPFGFGQGAP